MDKALERHTFPEWRQEVGHLTSCVQRRFKMNDKNFPTRQVPGPDGFTDEFYQKFEEELIQILHKFF